ncbi:MAG: T9SS type A sorting domain-containing protein [Bacteroidia bacterium]|nr:T9SS type A sorting domain-containing protein [Bacteroidia bacterium]
MKKSYNYNELVRFYNRSRKKLSNLLSLGKNEYKQDILKRRIARLFQLLTGMQTQLKLSTATFALTAGFVLFQPNAATAQSFPTQVANPFGLAATPAQWSTPWFVDLDNDGDKDIMSGTTAGNFHYYQNVGTASAPNFTASVMNPFGITGIGATQYSQPSFTDIDNDGDLDMFSGSKGGDIWYLENTGTVTAPVFAAPLNAMFGLSAIATGYSAGSFVDLDNDGDKDFVAGDYYGDFFYYQNTGTAAAPAFGTPTTNPFGLATSSGYYSTATFVDLDMDGDRDMFSSNGGSFDYYQNTGTASAPAFATASNNPFLLTALTASLNGACASFADLDNDGDMDLVSGASNGNIVYYENAGNVGIAKIEEVAGVSIYPNPTADNVTIKLNNTSEALLVQVTNVLGQVVSTSVINNSKNVIELPEAKGMYFVKVSTSTEDKSNIFKITKN